mgnify:FL=1
MPLPWMRTRPARNEEPLHEFMLPQALPRHEETRDAPLPGKIVPSRLFFQLDGRRRTVRYFDGEWRSADADRHRFTGDRARRRNQALAMLRRVTSGTVLADFEAARFPETDGFFGRPVNVFQYNRRTGNRTAALWRLPGAYVPGPHLGGTGGEEPRDTHRFRDKRPRVYWRGPYTGARWVTPFEFRCPDPGTDEATLVDAARYHSRAAAVLMSAEDPERYDFRFADPRRSRGLDCPYTATLAPREAFLANRYVLCPTGTDVAPDLYWVIATRSLAFKEDSAYEVVPDYFLRPWVHYVPVARGLTDLDDKFEYCERHPDLCERMLDAANAAYRRMRIPDLWRDAEDTVLERLGLQT